MKRLVDIETVQTEEDFLTKVLIIAMIIMISIVMVMTTLIMIR